MVFCFSITFSATLPTKGEHGLKDLIFEVHFACSLLALYLRKLICKLIKSHQESSGILFFHYFCRN